MGIWYQIEKTEKGINDFLDCHWGFHNFRIERVAFIPSRDAVEIFLKYDTGTEGVLLQFSNLRGINVNVDIDYEADWLYGASLILRDTNTLLWVAADDVTEANEYYQDVLKGLTWVEADRLVWAVTDENGAPVELPYDRLHQIWNSNGTEIAKDFGFQEVVN